MVQIGPDQAWLRVCCRTDIQTNIWSLHLNTQEYDVVAESFKILIKMYGKHVVVYTDDGTWYPEACISLGLTRA